ncbi:MAG: ATP-dependent DNA helicase, partial [Hyphomicrobiales bacterium]
NADTFQTGSYSTPGWQRAQKHRKSDNYKRSNAGPRTIEGELVAKSSTPGTSAFALGERVFHMKFGYGHVAQIDGNKLTVDFDKAGRKKVVDSFLETH